MTLKHLYFSLKWKEGLSPFQIGPPFLCFENGMFNTMKSLSPAPSFSVMGSKLQRGALFMGRLVCAGMRTKESRKLALECHAGDKQPTGGCAFSKHSQRTRVQIPPTGLEPQEGAAPWGANTDEIWRYSLIKWALPCGCLFPILHFNFYNGSAKATPYPAATGHRSPWSPLAGFTNFARWRDECNQDLTSLCPQWKANCS